MTGQVFFQKRRRVRWRFYPIAVSFFVSFSPLWAETASNPSSPAILDLRLEECVQRVVDYNEAVQIRGLDVLASRKRWQAARGVFEPELVGSAEHNINDRKNTAEEQSNLGGLSVYNQENNLYSSGLEMLVPTGARVRLGYTLRDLRNNRQPYYGLDREYESFAGLNLTQPLLKNGGYRVTMAAIRLAAGESALAFQEYRRQMISILSRGENGYWDLVFAQEQDRIRGDSVKVAETLLADNRERVRAGKASELEVLQAEAGAAFRRARQKEAAQKLAETMNRLTALFSGSSFLTTLRVRAIDAPTLRAVEAQFYASMLEAFESNPDYLSQRQQVMQEDVRLVYARNQRWPQLDLKASYGLNGLGSTPSRSWQDIEQGDFEAWSVGVEFRIPLGGGIKGRNELAAAQLRKKAALLGLKSIEVDLASAMDLVIHRISSLRDMVANYRTVVEYNERLLATELARLEAGKTDSRKVLEVEETLAEARSAALESLIGYQKTLADWAMIKGSSLKAHNVELTQAQLEHKTAAALKGRDWTDVEFKALRKETRAGLEQNLAVSRPLSSERSSSPIPSPPTGALDQQQGNR